MSQDANTYPDPDQLRPERFLNHDGQAVSRRAELPTFGYGRRLVMRIESATILFKAERGAQTLSGRAIG